MYLFILYQIHRVFLVRLANSYLWRKFHICSAQSSLPNEGGISLCSFPALHFPLWSYTGGFGESKTGNIPLEKQSTAKVLKWNIYKTHGIFQVCSQNEAFSSPVFLFWCLYQPLLNFQWLTWQSDSLDSWFPSMYNTYIMSLFLLFTFLLCLMKINLPLPK